MASLALYLTASVLLAQSTVAFNCSKAPIYVDIHKRAVHDSPVFQYGSFIGVGTPAQNHSLWPSLSQNHTSFASTDYCNNSTLTNCTDATGGQFDTQESSSFIGNDKIQLLDHNPNGTFTGDLAQDTLHLYTHYFETDPASQNLVPNSTIEVASSGEINPGRVGMGLSSTLLQDLVTQGLIAARTYSLYIGQGFDRAAGMVNGSNTYGGYDSGRFTGAVHTYPMTTGNQNPMSVRVKDIYISNTNDPSTNVSLFDTTKFPSSPAPQEFEAQITTDQYPLSLPYQITQNFIAQLDATSDNTYGDNSLKLKSPFNGSLSIVLDDGFTVTLPPEVLSNVSNITPIQSRTKDDTSPFFLSTAFLTQVYLMIDFEDYVFHLASAVQKNAPVMPVTFCPKSTPTPYVPPKQSAFVAQGLIGAVIGGVLGGIGLAITGWCFFLGVMRKRQERRWERRRELEGGLGGKVKGMGMSVEVEDVPEFDPPPKSATPFFWKKMGR